MCPPDINFGTHRLLPTTIAASVVAAATIKAKSSPPLKASMFGYLLFVFKFRDMLRHRLQERPGRRKVLWQRKIQWLDCFEPLVTIYRIFLSARSH